MKNQFTISSAYQWKKDGERYSNSEKAIKHICKSIKARFLDNENKKFNYNINYKKLRASAGRTMLKSIIKRIEDSQVVIIDITTENKNVFIEAGVAMALEKSNDFLSIYFIREQNKSLALPAGIPSDLQGYFISEYVIDKKGNVVFKDSNSLRMSVESDVKDYFNAREQSFNPIDETIF